MLVWGGRGGFSKCCVFLSIFTVHSCFSFTAYFSQTTGNESQSWEGLGLREVPVTTCQNRNPQFQLQYAPPELLQCASMFPPEYNFLWPEFSALPGFNKVWKEHPHFCLSQSWTSLSLSETEPSGAHPSSIFLPALETTLCTFRQLMNFFAKQRLIHFRQYLSFSSRDNYLQFSGWNKHFY